MSEPTHHHTVYNGPVIHQQGDNNHATNHGSVTIGHGDQELAAAVGELRERLRAIEDRLTPDQARLVEEARPVLDLNREEMAARGLTLARLGGLANVIGPMAQPVADAVGKLIQLLG
ncbi:hypothetical protein ACIQCR_20715 [Streptomyces sp. NPDC093249]|uniref:hypothetical protein n=1 Tax=unclassified Streptomyces TaxID=2593676 RepID=UPI00344EDB2C